MKKMLLYGFSCVLLLVLAACGETNEEEASESAINEQRAMEFGEKFIKRFYTIDDLEVDVEDLDEMMRYIGTFEFYLTEEEYEELKNKREFLIPVEVATTQKETISVEDITLEEDSQTEEEDTINLTFSFTAVFTNEERKEVEETEIEGEMTVQSTDDGFVISRYYDRNFPVEKTQE